VEHIDPSAGTSATHLESGPRRDDSEQTYNMVQGNDSHEVNSDTHLDDSVSSSCDDNAIDAHTLNEELSMFCENLLSKYKLLKSKSFDLKEENKNLFSKLNMILQERIEISNERDSLKVQLDLSLNENEILKSKNDLDHVLKKNEVLYSKLEFVLKENDSLQNKIALVSKELECVLKETFL